MISHSDPSRRPFRVNPHIEPRPRHQQSMLIGVGVAVVAVVALGLYWYWGSASDAQQLILNTVALRKGPPEVVKRSALIAQTNTLVEGMGNKRIQGEWDGLAQCMAKGCIDPDYYNFIITVTTQKRVANRDLLYNLILANKYWGTNEIIDFSQALTKADTAVEQLGSREASKKWNEIVECDGKCPEKNDLFFEMIKLVVMAG